MIEDEAAKDRNMGDASPKHGTRARSDATGVMSWGIELKITHRSEVG